MRLVIKTWSQIILCFLITTISANVIAEEPRYTFGVVPQFESRRLYKIWQPILDEVSRISDVKIELTATSNIPLFEKQLNNGEFDFAYMNPYHAIVSNKSQGYLPILRDTGRSLFGVIVVKKNNPIKSIAELDGETVAFPAPNALGASLLPRAEFTTKYKVEIKELYVKSHSSVYLNVILGKALAGGGVQSTLLQQPEKIRNKLRVLHETVRVPPHPIAAHPRVDKKITDKIRFAFIALGETEKGRSLLKQIPMKKIGNTDIGDYETLKKMNLERFYTD